MTKLFPSIIIAMNIGAAIVYVIQTDWRHVIYWLSAAILTASVTF